MIQKSGEETFVTERKRESKKSRDERDSIWGEKERVEIERELEREINTGFSLFKYFSRKLYLFFLS